MVELPWWSGGQDSALLLQGVMVEYLVGSWDLTCSLSMKKKKTNPKSCIVICDVFLSFFLSFFFFFWGDSFLPPGGIVLFTGIYMTILMSTFVMWRKDFCYKPSKVFTASAGAFSSEVSVPDYVFQFVLFLLWVLPHRKHLGEENLSFVCHTSWILQNAQQILVPPSCWR